MIGAHLVLGCQRTDCDATVTIDLGDAVPVTSALGLYALDQLLREEWPEGWGWDQAGVNRVLHCPEHRGGA